MLLENFVMAGQCPCFKCFNEKVHDLYVKIHINICRVNLSDLVKHQCYLRIPYAAALNCVLQNYIFISYDL